MRFFGTLAVAVICEYMPENLPFRREQARRLPDVASILTIGSVKEYDPELFASTYAVLQKEYQDEQDPAERLRLLERRFIDCAAQALIEKESRGGGVVSSTKIPTDRSRHYQQNGFMPLQLMVEKMQYSKMFATNSIRALFERLEVQGVYQGSIFAIREQVHDGSSRLIL